MRSTTIKALFTFGLVATLSAPVLAQGRGGGGMMGGGGGVNIIANAGVQKELALTPEQSSKISQIADDMRAEMTEARQGFADLDQAERQTKMMAMNRTMNEALIKDLGAVLKPEQLKRFKQIEFQQMGAQALASPAIAKELKVTDAQAEKVKALLADSMTQTREIMQASQDDRAAGMAKVAEVRKETTAKALALMTPEQKTAYAEMAGAAFDYKPEMPRPRNN